jgi:hypothetical protein
MRTHQNIHTVDLQQVELVDGVADFCPVCLALALGKAEALGGKRQPPGLGKRKGGLHFRIFSNV